jgi:hypothetical protein
MPRTTLALVVAARPPEADRGALIVLSRGQHGDTAPRRAGFAVATGPRALTEWLVCFPASSGGVLSAVTWSSLELFTYVMHENRQEVMQKFRIFVPKPWIHRRRVCAPGIRISRSVRQ